jgi:hypothetical protein
MRLGQRGAHHCAQVLGQRFHEAPVSLCERAGHLGLGLGQKRVKVGVGDVHLVQVVDHALQIVVTGAEKTRAGGEVADLRVARQVGVDHVDGMIGEEGQRMSLACRPVPRG